MPEIASPAVEIVIPVYNEEHALEASVRKLHRYMKREFTFAFRLTIADNASVDGTLAKARTLAEELAEVDVLHLDQKGRGRALRAAWMNSDAEVVAYMDVDLSTELSALPSLLVPLLQRRADVAIGSRLTPGAEVTRGFKRELISRSYNILLRIGLGVGFSDAQCGFKAVRRELAAPLLGRVQDERWFFDTELLYQAERARLAIHEVPVRWVDDEDSRVQLVATACEDLRGIRRLRRVARTCAADSDAIVEAPAGKRRDRASGAALFDLADRRA
ncbi:MAG TPA: dolichyl-phosphate beta-glucosyltransferase [Solirubrobacteraceae bacterium]|jgi:glycosyltransferase involved in cell wall biosynthesis|nr:dolichyl-phosphate beta-glucosyltransferase [Solirubrobacteraceae bacterium]